MSKHEGLTIKQEKYLRDYLEGYTILEIANKYGKHWSTISHTIHNGIGQEYKGVDLRTIRRKELIEILSKRVYR